MADDNDVDEGLYYNCTMKLLEEDIFAHYANISVLNLNRTELDTLVIDILEEMSSLTTPSLFMTLKKMYSDCVFPPMNRFVIAWWQKLVWSLVFAVMLFVATGGNAIVMWIVLAHRRMRTVTNYFLVNLSVSDLLMALLNCVFNFTFMLNSDWPFGPFYCTVNNYVAHVSLAASAFTLMAISMDRYMAIVRPLQHHMSRSKARVGLLFIWLGSCVLALPCILYSTTMTRSYKNGGSSVICFMNWPDGHFPSSSLDYIYNLVILAVTYAIPMTAMAVCYSLMGCELWGSRSIGEFTQRQRDSVKSKRKVVRMFIIVVTIFALCWLPYHGFFVYVYHHPEMSHHGLVHHTYLAFYWLAMANTMVNPIIYYWMNHKFRVYFQQIICHCMCFRSSENCNFELTNTKHQSQQSELVRSRSGRGNNMASGHCHRRGYRQDQRQGQRMTSTWQRRTQDTEVRYLNGETNEVARVVTENGTACTRHT